MKTWDRLRGWWWWIWTGHSSRRAARRALEQDVRRFNGEVLWRD